MSRSEMSWVKPPEGELMKGRNVHLPNSSQTLSFWHAYTCPSVKHCLNTEGTEQISTDRPS